MFEISTSVTVGDGKYKVHVEQDPEACHFAVVAYRDGEKWRDCTGDKLILALVHAVDDLQCKVRHLSGPSREEL